MMSSMSVSDPRRPGWISALNVDESFSRQVRTIVPKDPSLHYLVADANGNSLAGIADPSIAYAFTDHLNNL